MYCSQCGKEINQDEKFCKNCGTAVTAEQLTQNNCSPNLHYPKSANQIGLVSNYNALFAIGVILIIAGIIGFIFAVVTIVGDINDSTNLWGLGYTYSGNLSSHEIQMIATVLVSLIGGLVGLVMITNSDRK